VPDEKPMEGKISLVVAHAVVIGRIGRS
jgi:hypothetical protein